jgi:hypothetical protein
MSGGFLLKLLPERSKRAWFGASSLTAIIVCLLSGCVSNKTVQTVQVGDDQKSCAALQAEMVQLGAKFEEVKDESGVTGKNVGMALLFWPGIIVNESRANKNEESIDRRLSHLTGLYNAKCIEDESRQPAPENQTK